MKDYTKYVSPFQGNGEIALPEPTYPASTWHFIKGLTGNTHPGAALPFGKYSCLAFDGGYPTGYGINCHNSGEPIVKLFDSPKFIGLSHFHQSGTGAVGFYYNYALAVPFYGDFPDFAPRDMTGETAEPGYYAVQVDGIKAEATVSEYAVLHRYSFDDDGGRIAIDFANDGLYWDVLRGSASGRVSILSEHEVMAQMKLCGLTLWFDVICDGTVEGLFTTDRMLDGASAELPVSDDKFRRIGAVFQVGRSANVRLAVSTISAAHAHTLLEREMRSFDDVRLAAKAEWNRMLSVIEIETDDERELEIFYSNLYHTLVKPADFTDEAFLFDSPDGSMLTDIVTMWDIYKTQLPFLFTFYPEISEKLMKTFERFGEKYGCYPHCLIFSDNLGIETRQARTLAEYAIVDAYLRGIKGDYEKMLGYCRKDFARFPDFYEDSCEYASHILDMAEAMTAVAMLARRLGKHEEAAELEALGKKVIGAFDADGFMREDSPYYEGNRYNYSFRPLADMEKRIGICGAEKLKEEALRFFGYKAPEDTTSRFEGFNNETDMEAPCFLHFLGLRDEMCEVITSGTDSMFTTGSGGIPGNADSGGLTACYLWNVLGIFPLSGQDKYIIGTPRYRRAVLHMHTGDLTILRIGNGIYTEKAVLNGRPTDNCELSVSEVMQGGILEIYMKPER